MTDAQPHVSLAKIRSASFVLHVMCPRREGVFQFFCLALALHNIEEKKPPLKDYIQTEGTALFITISIFFHLELTVPKIV